MTDKKKVVEVDVATFEKDTILNSKHFVNRKSILSVLLKDEKQYSLDEVEEILKKYMNKEVK